MSITNKSSKKVIDESLVRRYLQKAKEYKTAKLEEEENKKIDKLRRLYLGPLYDECRRNPEGVRRDKLEEQYNKLIKEGRISNCNFNEFVKTCNLKTYYTECSKDAKCIEKSLDKTTEKGKDMYSVKNHKKSSIIDLETNIEKLNYIMEEQNKVIIELKNDLKNYREEGLKINKLNYDLWTKLIYIRDTIIFRQSHGDEPAQSERIQKFMNIKQELEDTIFKDDIEKGSDEDEEEGIPEPSSSSSRTSSSSTSTAPPMVPEKKKEPLPQGWKEYKETDGNRPYYFHVETQKAQWKRPTTQNPSPIEKDEDEYEDEYEYELELVSPIINGLIGLYLGGSLTDKSWVDLSGYNNDAENIGSYKAYHSFVKNNNDHDLPVVKGNPGSKIIFPPSILPEIYTLITVARYTDSQRGRIFDGMTKNWLSGFWGDGKNFYHEGWVSAMNGNGKPGNDWIINIDTGDSVWSNGKDITSNSNLTTSDRLTINAGFHQERESSSFEVAYVAVFDRRLTKLEIKEFNEWLSQLFNITI